VRNYQARNFMLKEMQIGDKVCFYHSSWSEPGSRASQKVSSAAYPMAASLIGKPLFDAEAKRESPRWFNVDGGSSARPDWSSGRAAQPPLASRMRTSRARQPAFHHPVSADEWDSITRR